MELRELLTDFSDRHDLRLTDLTKREHVAIRSTSGAHHVVTEAYGSLSDSALSDPAVGVLLHMLHRNFEHAEAAIVAFVSGCAASAEVISRAAVESSVNIRYILAGDRAGRLRAYFEHHLSDVDNQVQKWKADAVGLGGADAAVHTAAAERRSKANACMRKFADQFMGITPHERWPRTVAERFKAIGETLSYRTFYARMGSETHADAEETLRYLLGYMQPDPAVFEAMALETIWMTRLHIHYAISAFLRASLGYAEAYSMSSAAQHLKTQLRSVEKELRSISKHVGAGLV